MVLSFDWIESRTKTFVDEWKKKKKKISSRKIWMEEMKGDISDDLSAYPRFHRMSTSRPRIPLRSGLL